MEIQTSFVVVPFVNRFSLLLQYYSAITVCWQLEVQTRQFAISDITYACRHNEGRTDCQVMTGITSSWMSTVAPPFSISSPHAPDMHLPKEFLLFSYGTVKSCDIRNCYSSCFHVHFWTPNSLLLEQPLMLSVYWLQSENTLANTVKCTLNHMHRS